MITEVLKQGRDAQEEPFEKWWEDHGQFCYRTGGQYEKGFAWEAWNAALAAQQESNATKTYSDGTLVTGAQPLPRYSPREMDILYLALEVAQKAWDGDCEYSEIEWLAWNLRNGLRELFKDAGIPLDQEPPTAVPDAAKPENGGAP